MIYLELFIEFFKIGLFSIGGGQATIPFLEALVTNKGWFTTNQLIQFIGISESTPGAIGVNMATFSGFLAANDNIFMNCLGGVVATIGLITPSIIIIIIISFFLQAFKTNEKVGFVFYGLRPASTALIAAALYTLMNFTIIDVSTFSKTFNFWDLINVKNCIFALVLGCFIFKYKAHPILYIIIAAVIGIILKI